MLHGISKQEFGQELNKHLKPSGPIDSIELLQGRGQQLSRIDQALFTPGRHIFIYGDRGVGKSSLAQTAANQYQSSDEAVLLQGCTRTSTFLGVFNEISKKAIKKIEEKKITFKAGLKLKFLSLERTSETTKHSGGMLISTMDDALSLIDEISKTHSTRPIIVIDEFDAIESAEERAYFSEFLKMMGDSHTWVPIIFTGIANSLENLLGAHQSSYRQIEAIYLDRLSWDGRWDIFKQALDAFDVKYHPDIPYRVAGISDGFPYYVHSITEKLMWAVYSDEEEVSSIDLERYFEAVVDAAEAISTRLKGPYDKATERNLGEQYHYVIWGAAATSMLKRQVSEMYESYSFVVQQLKSLPNNERVVCLERETFSRRISSLTKDSFGGLLTRTTSKNGFYEFSENMIRGYAKLVAEIHGVEIWKQDAPTPRNFAPIPWSQINKSYRNYKSGKPQGYPRRTNWNSKL